MGGLDTTLGVLEVGLTVFEVGLGASEVGLGGLEASLGVLEADALVAWLLILEVQAQSWNQLGLKNSANDSLSGSWAVLKEIAKDFIQT